MGRTQTINGQDINAYMSFSSLSRFLTGQMHNFSSDSTVNLSKQGDNAASKQESKSTRNVAMMAWMVIVMVSARWRGRAR